MAFPNIKPILPGRDGWSEIYDTDVSRLLFHCGLRPCQILYSGARQQTVINWILSDSRALAIRKTNKMKDDGRGAQDHIAYMARQLVTGQVRTLPRQLVEEAFPYRNEYDAPALTLVEINEWNSPISNTATITRRSPADRLGRALGPDFEVYQDGMRCDNYYVRRVAMTKDFPGERQEPAYGMADWSRPPSYPVPVKTPRPKRGSTPQANQASAPTPKEPPLVQRFSNLDLDD